MSSLICCCARGEGTGKGKREDVDGEDYLLPGGEWDPSVSTSPSRIANSSRGGSQRSQHRPNSVGSRGGSGRSRFTSFLARQFRGSRSSQRSRVEADGGAAGGDYQPPPLQPSRSLPTYEEFRLLKTVGRGAFGKVGEVD